MCEHAFCRACINEWLTRQPTCPVDRNALNTANLRAVPRILRNLLSRYVLQSLPSLKSKICYFTKTFCTFV